ncbi:hypothetical protein [Actinoplanes sp. RD1]|uniref:hypothetical protein n=1 Tax=Actinoplanes sp. RD1 TaxID=3064538 RepID=UPI0027412561|nr:hypothetical protein [Actinoplanes sp. RD1]
MTDDAARDRAPLPDGGNVYGHPASAPPVSGSPYAGQPSGAPYPGQTSGSPFQASGAPYPGQETYGNPYGQGQDQYGLDIAPMSGGGPAYPPAMRRIEPSPPPQRGKLIVGAVAGLVAGLLVGGIGAFFIGRSTAGGGDPAAPGAAQQPAVVAQAAEANRAKFAGDPDLAALGEPWLADVSGCAGDADSGGPKLGDGQKTHVLCRYGGIYLHFVAYQSADAKAADMGYRQQVALNSSGILPGAEQPARKLGGVTGVSGNYVEYATKSGKDPALCGIYWNRDNTQAAVYLDVICDSLGGKWDPLRAVWERHS